MCQLPVLLCAQGVCLGLDSTVLITEPGTGRLRMYNITTGYLSTTSVPTLTGINGCVVGPDRMLYW